MVREKYCFKPEKTTNTIHFLMYEIAKNQRLQEEIYQEIRTINTENISEEDLAKIPLIKATLKESQRLNGLAPIIGRILDQDLVIDEYVIPRGVRNPFSFILI